MAWPQSSCFSVWCAPNRPNIGYLQQTRCPRGFRRWAGKQLTAPSSSSSDECTPSAVPAARLCALAADLKHRGEELSAKLNQHTFRGIRNLPRLRSCCSNFHHFPHIPQYQQNQSHSYNEPWTISIYLCWKRMKMKAEDVTTYPVFAAGAKNISSS